MCSYPKNFPQFLLKEFLQFTLAEGILVAFLSRVFVEGCNEQAHAFLELGGHGGLGEKKDMEYLLHRWLKARVAAVVDSLENLKWLHGLKYQ